MPGMALVPIAFPGRVRIPSSMRWGNAIYNCGQLGIVAKLDPRSCLGGQIVLGLVEGPSDGANLFFYITPAMPSAFHRGQ